MKSSIKHGAAEAAGLVLTLSTEILKTNAWRRRTTHTQKYLQELPGHVILMTSRKRMPVQLTEAESAPAAVLFDASINFTQGEYSGTGAERLANDSTCSIVLKYTLTSGWTRSFHQNQDRPWLPLKITVMNMGDGADSFIQGKYMLLCDKLMHLLNTYDVRTLTVNCYASQNRAPTFLCCYVLSAWFPSTKNAYISTTNLRTTFQGVRRKKWPISYFWYSLLQKAYWDSQHGDKEYPADPKYRPGFCTMDTARHLVWEAAGNNSIPWGGATLTAETGYAQGPLLLTSAILADVRRRMPKLHTENHLRGLTLETNNRGTTRRRVCAEQQPQHGVPETTTNSKKRAKTCFRSGVEGPHVLKWPLTKALLKGMNVRRQKAYLRALGLHASNSAKSANCETSVKRVLQGALRQGGVISCPVLPPGGGLWSDWTTEQ
jgi:hypothetical protein